MRVLTAEAKKKKSLVSCRIVSDNKEDNEAALCHTDGADAYHGDAVPEPEVT